MKLIAICTMLVIFVVGHSYVDAFPERNLVNILGGAQDLKAEVVGFAPDHEGHIHSPQNRKAGCGASSTTAATTAAG